MKRMFSIIGAVVVCASLLFVSCSSGGKSVMTLGNASVNEGTYKYWMATYKARYLSTYTDINDTASFWSAKMSDNSDLTNGDFLNDLIRQNIKTNLVAMQLFAEEGLTVSDSDKAKIDEYISSLVDERANGSRKEMNSALAPFGININMMKTIFINEQKVSSLFDYFYGDNGKTPLTDSDRETYYRDNYIRFIQININNAFVYEEDENGKYIQGTDGKYKTRDLTEKEKKEKSKVIAEIDLLLENGVDIEELYEDYSENTSYPNGYYFSSETALNYSGEIVAKAFTLNEGEWIKYESAEYGTFYLKRVPLDEGAYSNQKNSDFFDEFDTTVAQSLFDAMMTSHYDDIVIDETLLNEVTVANVSPNYYLY